VPAGDQPARIRTESLLSFARQASPRRVGIIGTCEHGARTSNVPLAVGVSLAQALREEQGPGHEDRALAGNLTAPARSHYRDHVSRFRWRSRGAPPTSAPQGPTDAELKVRLALAVSEQAAQAAAARTVGLDTKASILLVVAGLIVTSSFEGDGLLYRGAAVLALVSSILALWSLWPRGVKGIHPTTITHHLESVPDTFAGFEYWLLALQKAASIERERYLKERGRLLIIGFALAVAAMAIAGMSVLLEGDWLANWLHTLHHGNVHVPRRSPSPTPTP